MSDARSNVFAPGEKVQMATGGPLMMVAEIDGAMVTCQWFDRHGDLKVNTFPAVVLAKHKPVPARVRPPRKPWIR